MNNKNNTGKKTQSVLSENNSLTSMSTSSPNKSISTSSPVKNSFNSNYNKNKKLKYYAKITRNKTQKCKFNANNRSFQKPVDFVLEEDHFFKITDEV